MKALVTLALAALVAALLFGGALYGVVRAVSYLSPHAAVERDCHKFNPQGGVDYDECVQNGT
jgi:hypothetical protein